VRGSALLRAVEVMEALRAPDGDAWTHRQTHASLARYLLEETHEVLEVIDDPAGHEPGALADELGDLLFQILFHARVGEEEDPPGTSTTSPAPSCGRWSGATATSSGPGATRPSATGRTSRRSSPSGMRSRPPRRRPPACGRRAGSTESPPGCRPCRPPPRPSTAPAPQAASRRCWPPPTRRPVPRTPGTGAPT